MLQNRSDYQFLKHVYEFYLSLAETTLYLKEYIENDKSRRGNLSFSKMIIENSHIRIFTMMHS